MRMMTRFQYHGSDVDATYGPGELRDAVINFANNLDPNGPTLINWPKYTNDAPALFTMINTTVPSVTLEGDTYRAEAMAVATNITLAHPF